MTKLASLPRRVSVAIVRKLNAERRVAVVRGRNGGVSVRSLDRYMAHRERMRKDIRKSKPWEARKKDPLWFLGTRPLGAPRRITRADIYADD